MVGRDGIRLTPTSIRIMQSKITRTVRTTLIQPRMRLQMARGWFFSAGAAVRINILNAAVVQIYYAVPFQRSAIAGTWGFLFESGW